jgi:hypothetical protein
MSDYGFILDEMKFSFSSLSSFETCPYMFYLTYIQAEERLGNFFSDYGSFIHSILEKYFRGELTTEQLSSYYQENYYLEVVQSPPPYPKGMADNYRNAGQSFFDYFYFDKDKYNILGIEDYVNSKIDVSNIVFKPDLILQDKETKENILVDYKTSNPYTNGKLVKKKFAEYEKQMYIYTYFIRKEQNIKIDKMRIWFVRSDKFEEIIWNEENENKAIEWAREQIKKIMAEKDFVANNRNQFFCQNLCSTSSACKFKNLPPIPEP